MKFVPSKSKERKVCSFFFIWDALNIVIHDKMAGLYGLFKSSKRRSRSFFLSSQADNISFKLLVAFAVRTKH